MADFREVHSEFYDTSHARYKGNQYKKAAFESFLVDEKNI